MPKTKTKHKTTGEKITAAEVAARREELMLRRARNQQIRIRQLARALAQAIVRADVVRVETARMLCDGSAWGVFGVVEWDLAMKRRAELADDNNRLLVELSKARRDLELAQAVLSLSKQPFPDEQPNPAPSTTV